MLVIDHENEQEAAKMSETNKTAPDASIPNSAQMKSDSMRASTEKRDIPQISEVRALEPAHRTRIAIITGADSGLGREFARQIDAAGDADEIWLISRNEEKLEAVAETLRTPAIAVPADLSKPADIATIADMLKKDGLTVAYLVNSAGFGRFGAWSDISDEAAQTMIELNCEGLVLMTRACLPYMERGSRIIQMASAAAFVPLPYMNLYAATKAFVLRYTRGLRWELHGTGITATAVCPTWVKTGFESEARKSGNGRAVNHLLFAQRPETVVSMALAENRLHFAVACCGPASLFLRIIGKVVPSCITMAGWNAIRRL